jgi:hypothetical protein
MGYECLIIFDHPHDVPSDIIDTIFDKVSKGETFGKIGTILYSVHPESGGSFECTSERDKIGFLLQ